MILFVPPFLRLRRPRRLLSRGMRPVSSRFLQSSSSFECASPSRIYARENMRKKRRERERERKKSLLSRESSFFSPSVSSTLSFFLLLSLFPLSRGSLLVPVVPHAALCPFFFLSQSLPLRGVIAHGVSLSLSRRSRSFSSSPSRRTQLLLSRWFSYSALSFFFSSFLLFYRGWLLFHPSSHQREFFSLSPPPSLPQATPPPPYRIIPFSPPFSSSFFVPVDRRCSALFEFKHGSHWCLVSPS